MIIPPLFLVIGVAALVGAFFAVGFWRDLRKMKLLKAGRGFLLALLMFLIAATAMLLLVAHRGYRMLTNEETAAIVCVEPVEKQHFRAVVILPDSSRTEYSCRGDQLYIDAHILKWHPWLNLLGIHTTYELDRLSGRYFDIDDEKQKPRTVYALSEKKILNLFNLRRKWEFLHPLLDAQYGSATFVDVSEKTSLEVNVSTSGLLVRKDKARTCDREK